MRGNEPKLSELDKAFCNINAAWDNLLEAIRAIGCPVDVQIAVNDSKDMLAWMKRGKEWTICVAYGEEWLCIQECPLADRMALYKFIPLLTVAMKNRLPELAKEILSIADNMKSLTQSLHAEQQETQK